MLADAPISARKVAVPMLVVGAGVVFGVGLYDLARGRDVRLARVIIVAGLIWSLSALSASSHSGLHSVGHVAQWFVEFAILYLLLAYPHGRVTEAPNRRLVVAGALLLALLFLPTALVSPQLPHPSLWSRCTSACPANAFAITNSTPAFVQHFVVPVREVLLVCLLVAVVGAVLRRMRDSGPLLRRMYAPIVGIAIAQAIVFGLYFPIRRVDPSSGALGVISWIDVLSLPAVVAACGAGRLYQRIRTASVLDRIAYRVRSSATAEQVRSAMADALEDPSLRILHSFPAGSAAWVDESGAPVLLAPRAGRQAVTEVASGCWRIAVLHSHALAEDGPLVHAAAAYALAAIGNDHLNGELRWSLEQLAASRARGIAAEDRERQKIERDLHDGAQQRLLAVRVKLGLAAEKMTGQDPVGAEVIRALGKEIDATIDEVRSLARGIYPPLLADTGLDSALRAIGREAAVPTTVEARRLGRYPREIETTVYFSCCEALQNAAKHARGATTVMISVWQDSELHFEIRDDGAGFDVLSTPHGTGLTNLQNRLDAVRGTLTVNSVPGQGTEISGSIPLPQRP